MSDAQPDSEPYEPVPAPDYQGHLPAGRPRWKSRLLRLLAWGGAAAVVATVALFAGYLYLAREVPTFDTVKDYRPLVSSHVIARDGTVVGEFFKERRTVVPMEKIPRVLLQAVISAEDKDFYQHPGVNPVALVRAAIVDTLSGRKRLGASTITQQVVKNFFLSSEKKWKRKVKEILLSSRLEHNLSKDDILYLYLNQINFGKAHYGVEEASLYYFNQHVWGIDLGEAAILAGLPQNPSRIDPRRHAGRAKRRQIYVLDRMLANGYITRAEHDSEVEKPIVLPPVPPEPPGAFYLDEVRRQLVAQYGEAAVDGSGMTIEIAMDPKLQAAAETALRDGLRAVDRRQGYRGPRARLGAGQVEAARSALSQKLGQQALGGDEVSVVDLDGIPENDAAKPDSLARGARVRALQREAKVWLAPEVTASVPFSTMQWARKFSPEKATPLPRGANEVLAPGDLAEIRVLRLATTRDGPDHVRPTRLEVALEQDPLVEGAFVGIDLKTRQVVALVGGYDQTLATFNRATQARRQPGSAIKPFIYAAALESGRYTPTTRVDDSPEVIVDPWTGKPWKPQNFEKDEFAGPIPLRRALAESKNTVAVKLLVALGLDKLRTEAAEAGVTSDIPQSFTAALGTGEAGVLEMVNGYTTLATWG
ncbi:MAG: penicillin-binding protein, partial [Deltaproteobacteria bacterium]